MGERDNNSVSPGASGLPEQYGDGVDVEWGPASTKPDEAWNPWKFILWQVGLLVYAIVAATVIRAVYPSSGAFYIALVGPIAVWAIFQSIRQARRARATPAAGDESTPATRPKRPTGLEVAAIILYVGFAMMALSFGGQWAGGSPWDVAILSILTGSWLLVLAFLGVHSIMMGNRWARLRCRRCGHSRWAFGPPWLRRPVPGCTRCHLPWTLSPEVQRMTRLTGRDIVGYASMVAFALLIIAVIPVGRNLMPTRTLIRVLGESRDAPNGAWDELQSRTLTQEQKNQMFARLADRRERGLPLPYGSEHWVRDQLYALRTDPDSVAFYFPGWYELELVAINPSPLSPGGPAGQDSQVGVREPLTVELAVAKYDEAMSALLPLVYIEGFWLGDDRATLQHAQTNAVYQAGVTEGARYWETVIALRGPRAEFVLNQPGTTTVRAAVWLVVPANRSETPAITWNQDGSLNAPNALHVERRELVLPVEVR